jgi:hypothetical protein
MSLDVREPSHYGSSTPGTRPAEERRHDVKASEMDRLIEQHIAAETAGDTAGSVAMYTDDVEHDVVVSPTGPLHGKRLPRDSTST